MTTHLTKAAYEETIVTGMKVVDEPTAIPDSFWLYVDAIPPADRKGFTLLEANISAAYRSKNQSYDHVLFSTQTPNVFMVIVIDRRAEVVLGHHLLDLAALCGV